MSALREALESVGIDGLDSELIDFIVFYVYSRGGEDTGAVKYQVLFDIIDGVRDAKSVESRKRPESSSPAQLKARNKEKYSLEVATAKNSGQKDNASPEATANNEEEEEYKEEQFEQMLDKDDEEAEEETNPAAQAKKSSIVTP